MTNDQAVIIGAIASAAATVIHAIGSVTCQIIRTWKQPVSSAKPVPAPQPQPVKPPPPSASESKP